MTTINNEKYAVTPEARMIGILQRIFAVSVFGFVTASIASYLVGRQVEEQAPPNGVGSGQREHLAALREEQAALRRKVVALRVAVERLGQPAKPTPRPEQDQSRAPNERPPVTRLAQS